MENDKENYGCEIDEPATQNKDIISSIFESHDMVQRSVVLNDLFDKDVEITPTPSLRVQKDIFTGDEIAFESDTNRPKAGTPCGKPGTNPRTGATVLGEQKGVIAYDENGNIFCAPLSIPSNQANISKPIEIESKPRTIKDSEQLTNIEATLQLSGQPRSLVSEISRKQKETGNAPCCDSCAEGKECEG